MKDFNVSRIVGLQVENVQKLRAIDITPGRNVVVVGGKNDQGKSCVLDSILWALGGKKTISEMPIRNGEERAKIVVDLGDLIVTRTITAIGGSLTIKSRDGATYSSPQDILASLTGRLAFDPLEFTRQKPPEQKEALRRLVGIDFTEQDTQRAELYTDREATNRDLKAATAVLTSMPIHPTAPAVEIIVLDVVQKIENAQAENQKVAGLMDAARDAQGLVMEREQDLELRERDIAATEARIVELNRQLQTQRDERQVRMERLAEARAAAVKADEIATAAKTIDIEPFKVELLSAEAVNRKVRQNAEQSKQAQKVETLRIKSEELTKSIEHIDAEKEKVLKAAPFPVPGLSFSDSGVLYNGTPFSQASSAVKIRVSVAMGLALNPKLKVMLIRDGSLLDEDSLAEVVRMAEENDAQVWVERVGKGAECSIIIEEGEVLPFPQQIDGGNAA